MNATIVTRLSPPGKMLKTHLMEHTGENPCQCSQFGKTFSKINYHREQLRIHTGENPYQFTQCDKAFITYPAMRYHLRTH